MADDSWRTSAFRQNVVAKIEEAIKTSGMNTSRNSIEMENHVYQKARNKEEYLSFVARLILHVREMNSKKQPGQLPGQPQQQAPGMQDPINALQNLASQGSRNTMVGPPMGPNIPQNNPNLMRNQQMLMGQMPMQQMNQMPGQMPFQLQNQMQMMGGMPQMQPKPQLLNPQMMGGGGYVRQQGPVFAQSPLQGAQSPAGMSQPPSASPSLAPSPIRAPCMAPSPGASLNTPQQPGQSPCMTDEQAYREKVRQLSKYIEPLRKMIAKMGNDDVEKMSKMKRLLEILSNPQQRMPLDTLMKCEIVLEKIDFKRGDGSVTNTHLPFKEPHVFHALLDAVAQNLQSPVINHTLHRTFGPTLEALYGPEFKLVPALKKSKAEEPTSDIPDVLQGEIARLDQRFKVSLDPNQQPGSKSIHLVCWLDDKQLPCVPPISLLVPEEYPKKSPTCLMASHEYNATKFLSDVQTALLARIKKLPKFFSVSQLLDTWEMSVRQASAPNSSAPISSFAILMGM